MRGCLQKAKLSEKTMRSFKKGEFTWRIVLNLGRDPTTGKYRQRWVTFHGTKKQAEEKLNELVGEVHKGEFVEPSKTTLGEWFDEWLVKAIQPPRCTPGTYREYCHIVQKHLKPGLGHVLLQQLKPLHVERYYTERGVTLSPRSVALHHSILTSALNAAVNAGVLRSNVAQRATNKPRAHRTGDVLDNVWTVDDARQFMKTVKQEGNAQDVALFGLALDSGMRKGELLGLQWKDIDGASLRVERQLLGMKKDEATGAFSLDTSLPKGKRARSLKLSEETIALLREHKRQQAELKLKNRLQYVDHGLVFAQAWEQMSSENAALGGPLYRTTVGGLLDKFCRASGVKRITVHGLRHTSATLALSNGVPAKVVQERLGHRSAEMTNLYTHVLPSMDTDAAKRIAMQLYG